MSEFSVNLVAEQYPETPIEEIQNRLRLATYVNVQRGYMYYEVPKAGCTSLKTLIHRLEGLPPIKSASPEVRRDMFIHSRGQFKISSLLDLDDATQRHVLTSPNVFRFAVVRNPYTRLISAWRDKVLVCAPGFEHYYIASRGAVPNRFSADNLITFREFIETISKENLDLCNPHWRRQSQYIFADAIRFSKVGRVEHLQETISEFMSHAGFAEDSYHEAAMNASPVSTSSYDDALASTVYDLYSADFLAFDYDRNDWPRPIKQPALINEDRLIAEIAERNVVIGQLYSQLAPFRERWTEPELAPEPTSEYCASASFDSLFERYIEPIDGFLSKAECEFLYGLAKEVTEGCIVEVGSYRGRSTAALALGSLAGNRVPVYAIEPHESFQGVLGGEFGPIDRGHFMRSMATSGLFRIVRLVNLDSRWLNSDWPHPIGLLWIDGDHRYEAVRQDFDHWADKLLPNAIVAFDDAVADLPGPNRVLEEALRSASFEAHVVAGKIACLRKSALTSKDADSELIRPLARYWTRYWTGGDADVHFVQTADVTLYKPLLDLTSRTVTEYCRRHGYTYEAFIGICRGYFPWQATYNRILLLQRVLDSGFEGWVCYMDADAFVADLDFDLRSYLADKRGVAFIAATDRLLDSGRPFWFVNAGSFLVNLRNEEGRTIATRWVAEFNRITDRELESAAHWSDLMNDQDMLQNTLKILPSACERVITLRGEPNLLNYETGIFIKQILRSDGEGFADRIERVRRMTDDVLLREEVQIG